MYGAEGRKSQLFKDSKTYFKQPLKKKMGVQWLSGRVLDSRPRGRGFEPHRRHCIVSLSKNINPSLVLVQPRKTRPFITERLLMGRKESNQTKNQKDDQKLVFKTNFRLIQVKSVAKCSKGSILQYF